MSNFIVSFASIFIYLLNRFWLCIAHELFNSEFRCEKLKLSLQGNQQYNVACVSFSFSWVNSSSIDADLEIMQKSLQFNHRPNQ